MKFWNAYGSEHSANLVMIGHFKTNAEAEEAHDALEKIKQHLMESQENYEDGTRYSKAMRSLLMDLNLHMIVPSEINQLNYDARTRLEKERIVVTTDESDFSAILKLLVEYGAKVEVYSGHTYPSTGEGR